MPAPAWQYPVLRATTALGAAVEHPSEDDLSDLLGALTVDNPFVIVERVDREPPGQHFIQVYLNNDGSCQVEYREGAADRHFEAEVPGPFATSGHGAVARVVQDWAFERAGWREALAWVRWVG